LKRRDHVMPDWMIWAGLGAVVILLAVLLLLRNRED
jgi:LPXTG-motif cell wall-anchored protein